MISDLQSFLQILRQEGELVEIKAPVDPDQEAAEIHRRVIEQQGPALLFTNILGAAFPLVTNLFGTKRRVELAFGSRPERLIKEIASIPHELLPPSPKKLWAKRSLLADMFRIGLKTRSGGAVQEVIERPSKLEQLPLLKTWPQDGGAFITLPLVYTQHPTSGLHNLGMYRMQRFDDETLGLHCQIGKGGGFHLAEAERLGQSLPVNVYIGGPPALILSAIAPLPENVPELLLASLVMGGKLRLSKNPLGPLPLIADAEFALVGSVDPKELRPEGPFGDHYGYYSLQHDYPVFHCHGMLRRKSPVCAATVVGKPRQEDFFLGDYLQDLLSPLFPHVMPSVKDLWSYGETGYHSLASAVVQHRYKRETMVSAFRILGEGQLSLTKFLLITDAAIDLRNFRMVLEHVLARADFRSDLYIFGHLSMDTLDYTGPTVNLGSKGVLLGVGDALRDLPREFTGDPPPGVKNVQVFCGGCLVVDGPSYNSSADFGTLLAQIESLATWPLVVLVDDVSATCLSTESFLWTTFTRFEPAADIKSQQQRVEKNHVMHYRPIVIDARMKPWYPDEVTCYPDVAKKASARWREYFPEGF